MNPEKLKKSVTDYKIDFEKDKNGRLKKVSTYIGPVFYYILPEEKVRSGKIRITVLSALVCIFTLVPLLVGSMMMHKWLNSGSFIFCLLADVHLLMAVWLLWTLKVPFERKEKEKIFERIAICSVLDIIFSFTSLISQIVWHVKNASGVSEYVITSSTVLLLVTSVLLFNAKSYVSMREEANPAGNGE